MAFSMGYRWLVPWIVVWTGACGGSPDPFRYAGRYAHIYDEDLRRSSAKEYERECGDRVRAASPGPVEIEEGDGVDRCEAQAIGNERFYPSNGCGTVDPPLDDGAQWLVPVRFGAGATPLQPYRIDKRTGRITGEPVIPGAGRRRRVDESRRSNAADAGL